MAKGMKSVVRPGGKGLAQGFAAMTRGAGDSGSVMASLASGLEDLAWETHYRRQYPQVRDKSCLKEMLRLGRAWLGTNPYVGMMLRIKIGFFDYGFQLVAKEKKDRKAVEAWAEENRGVLKQLRQNVWEDFLGLDNVVMFWREENPGVVPVLLLPPERCNYTDKFGVEVLKYQPDLSTEDIKALEKAGVGKATIERYRQGEITLDAQYDEYYKVIKRERIGYGFGMPRLRAVFHELDEFESVQVGEQLLGFLHRLVMRHHKVGHEIRNGNYAGHPTHFAKKKRVDAILNTVKGKVGLLELVTNFDHTIEYPYPDGKLFDVKKWQAMVERFQYWVGPLAWILMAKGINLFLLRMLHTEAKGDREMVGPALEEVINQAFDAPGPVRVVWSDECFNDSRIAADMMKSFLTQGLLSCGTALERAGFDPEREEERKRDDHTKADVWKPVYDAAHGEQAAAKKGIAGKKPGQGE